MSEINAWVRDILRCPQCRSELRDVATDGDRAGQVGAVVALLCSSSTCGLEFPVKDGVPVLLIADAHPATRA